MAGFTSCPAQGGIVPSEVLPTAQLVGGADVAVTGITSRLDAVQPGDVFVALPERHDSLADVQEAIARGAAVVVVEQMLPLFGTPQLVVESASQAYALLCQALMHNPAESLRVIGIGGSHGKSSTALLLASILKTAGHAPSCFTNRHNVVAGQSTTSPASTDAASIAHNLAEAVASGSQHAVIEVCSNALHRGQLAGVPLDAACITNLFADNAPHDRSPLECRQQMLGIVEHLAPHGVLVANADDPDCVRALSTYDGAVVTFSQTSAAEIRGTVIEEFPGEQTFLLTIDGDTVPVRLPILGGLHVANCLAAAALATVYGVDLVTIARGLEAVQQLPGVMHRVKSDLDFATYVDSGASPEALRSSLSGVRRATSGRVIAVVPGLKSASSREVAQALADERVDAAAWQELPHQVREAITSLVVATTDQQPLAEVLAVRLSAIARAALAAQAGDAILVSGCAAASESRRRTNESVLIERLLSIIGQQRKLTSAA